MPSRPTPTPPATDWRARSRQPRPFRLTIPLSQEERAVIEEACLATHETLAGFVRAATLAAAAIAAAKELTHEG